MPILRRAPLIHRAREAHARIQNRTVSLPGAFAAGRARTPNLLIDEPEESQSVVILLDGARTKGRLGSITTTSSATGGLGGPNEPNFDGGMLWLRHDCKTLPVHNAPASHAGWFLTNFNFPGLYTIVQDTSHPEGTRNVIRIEYPDGFEAGRSPGHFSGFDKSGGQSSSTALKEWYCAVWIRLEGTDWEWPPSEQKLWYNASGSRTTHSGGTYSIGSNGAYLISSNGGVRTTSRRCKGCIIENHFGTGTIGVGPWRLLELHRRNSDVDQENGLMRAYVDGQLRLEKTDIIDQSTLDSDNDWQTGFTMFHWAPVYGGNGGAKSRADFMRLGGIYVTGIPQ